MKYIWPLISLITLSRGGTQRPKEPTFVVSANPLQESKLAELKKSGGIPSDHEEFISADGYNILILDDFCNTYYVASMKALLQSDIEGGIVNVAGNPKLQEIVRRSMDTFGLRDFSVPNRVTLESETIVLLSDGSKTLRFWPSLNTKFEGLDIAQPRDPTTNPDPLPSAKSSLLNFPRSFQYNWIPNDMPKAISSELTSKAFAAIMDLYAANQKIYVTAVEQLISKLGSPRNWTRDFKDQKSFSELDPKAQQEIENFYRSQYQTFGFNSSAEASEFLARATATPAERGLSMSIRNGTSSIHSFSIALIR